MLATTVAAAALAALAGGAVLARRLRRGGWRPALERIARMRDLTTLVDEAAGYAGSLLGVDAALVELWQTGEPADAVSVSSGLTRDELAEHLPELDSLAEPAPGARVAELLFGGDEGPAGELRGALVARLPAGREIAGRVVVFWRRGGIRPDERSLNELDLLVGAIVQAASRHEGLPLLANAPTRDRLTGLLNRRSFDEDLAREVERARRHRRGFSLLVVDVDEFGALNARLGRDGADAVLAELAGRLARSTRASDGIARIGRDEFGLVLVGGDGGAAVRVFERFRDMLTSGVGLTSIEVGASGGAAEFAGDSPEALLDRAYSALAAAKGGGERRIVVDVGNGNGNGNGS